MTQPLSTSPCAYYALGDVPLTDGGVLRNATLAYQTHGNLNAARDNCIVFPTYYTGTHDSNARLKGAGRALDPAHWFIVVPNLFGNGVSTSPSNAHETQRGRAYPHVSIIDNVRAQYRLVHEALGVSRVALATGWSMGAVQAYQWAIEYGDYVARLLPFCGAARCSPHNRVFIEGVRAALRADHTFADGAYQTPPRAGLKAFGRVYAGWAYSQTFFREGLYRNLGFASIEDYLLAWEDEHLAWDANDLMAKLWTWEHADPARDARFNGDFKAAMAAITARTIVMPADQDLYFTLEDNRQEAALISHAELRPIHSPYGHCAGAPGRFPAETAFIEQALRDLLASA
jgi:homoserine O-acetyltransferase